MKTTVCIAAPYPEIELARRWKSLLEMKGCIVTSRWLKAAGALNDEWAKKDLEDVFKAQVLLALNPPGYENAGTGGRHVELGYALALGRAIILVGERTNVFHYHSAIKVIDDTEDIVKHVIRAAQRG